jgi:hypothetical protein
MSRIAQVLWGDGLAFVVADFCDGDERDGFVLQGGSNLRGTNGRSLCEREAGF